jgi:hypothetical protein
MFWGMRIFCEKEKSGEPPQANPLFNPQRKSGIILGRAGGQWKGFVNRSIS